MRKGEELDLVYSHEEVLTFILVLTSQMYLKVLNITRYNYYDTRYGTSKPLRKTKVRMSINTNDKTFAMPELPQ